MNNLVLWLVTTACQDEASGEDRRRVPGIKGTELSKTKQSTDNDSKGSSSRNYSNRTLKILWGRAAGRCAVPECRVELLVHKTDYDPVVVIGDIAHITASSDKGPRADADASRKNRDKYDNLILLCKNCHTRIDGQKNTNTVEVIKNLKRDHEAWVRESLPERGRSTVGWTMLLLHGQHPIDADRCVDALSPDYPHGNVVAIPGFTSNEDWSTVRSTMASTVNDLLAQADPFDCRFAVFPLAPVSACITLGYLLTSRPRVRLFQYHRDAASWAWPDVASEGNDIRVEGLPDSLTGDITEISICFHLSAHIERAQVLSVAPDAMVIDILVPELSTGWLQSNAQLDSLGTETRRVFESLIRFCPNVRRWHVFYAGPALGAVRIGQQMNPTMTPPVCLYEFNRTSTPNYRRSICLGDDDNG